ncbi:hypothetical protein FQZ97_1189020 [compost metagenome]
MEHETAPPCLSVGWIDTVLKIDQLIEGDGCCSVRVRPYSGRCHDAGGLADAGAHCEVFVGDSRNALRQSLVDVRLKVDNCVL